MLKAFGNTDRVVKFDFLFSEKKPILLNTCATCVELPAYKKTMIQLVPVKNFDENVNQGVVHIWTKRDNVPDHRTQNCKRAKTAGLRIRILV